MARVRSIASSTARLKAKARSSCGAGRPSAANSGSPWVLLTCGAPGSMHSASSSESGEVRSRKKGKRRR